jgi:hypothetical protein
MLILTDLGFNSFGDSDIGQLLFCPFCRGLAILGRDAIRKKF